MTAGPALACAGLLADALAGHGRQDGGGVEPGGRGHAPPGGREPLPAGFEVDPPRQEPGRQSHVERAEDVAPPQRREEGRLGQRTRQDPGRLGHYLARLGVRRTAEHDDHAFAPGVRRQHVLGGRQRIAARPPNPRDARRAPWRRRCRRRARRATTGASPGRSVSEAADSAVKRGRGRGRARSGSWRPSPPRAGGGTAPATPRAGRRPG